MSAVLGALSAVLGALSAVLGALSAVLGALSAVLGALSSVLGAPVSAADVACSVVCLFICCHDREPCKMPELTEMQFECTLVWTQ